MKRGVFEILRRGVDNTIANWPLILIRIGEMMLFGLITLAAVFVALVPILVSIGIEVSKLETIEDLGAAMLSLMSRGVMLVWGFVAISVLLIVFVALHSVVEAGSARVYIDGERIAGPAMGGMRSRFRVFSVERWITGARDGWWTVFWIYNVAWGAAGLVLLIPLLPTLVGVILFREQPPALIVTGCVGLALTGLLMIVVGAVTGMWVNRAIADWAVHRSSTREALSSAWSAIKLDLGRHVLILLAVFVVSMAGSSFFAGFSFFAGLGDAIGGSEPGLFHLFMMPMRIAGSLFSTAFSAIVSAWYLASYAALAAE